MKGLISFDTAPASTSADKIQMTKATIQMIKDLDVEGKTKKAALDVIHQKFPDRGIANMISNNLAYTAESDHQTVKWCVNLDSILKNIEKLSGFEPAARKYIGPAFFLNGDKSVVYDDDVYWEEFPLAEMHTVEGAGHYIYNDKGKTTARLLVESLEKIEN